MSPEEEAAAKFQSLEEFLSFSSAGRNLLDEWAAEALDEEGNLRQD